MSDISTMEAPGTDTYRAQAESHGRHRGPVSGQEVSGPDAEAAPHGRHRKPSDQDMSA
ncbi:MULTISPECIES: hypothetical protein [Streptomyces]|uniref:Uncharacterized protein n=1 Tax=Streptomyces lutosisoli TaxID=2665721 RepID=A0ABW2VNF8_9ACTN|nr:hypothetical protein OG324_14535 [Streptomyces sp. NBC_01236]